MDNVIKNVSLDDALKEADNDRISQNQIIQRGTDARSGTSITRDATLTNRVLNGFQQNGGGAGIDFYGLKVSKPGFDVTTASNANLIFNSSQNAFKIITSGTATLSYDGSVSTFVTIVHNLSTIPIVLAYVQFPNDANFSPMGGQYVPLPVYINRAGLPSVQCTQSADATNIYLRVHDIYASGGSPEVYNFRYYILQETAN